jgi:two-component system, cell cycle response regulator DivK
MKVRILFVDDDPDSMRILGYALRNAGYELVPAYGGADAIAKVKRLRPDLVITDLAMPQVNGVEVIYTIKNDPDTQHIPVLAVTAYIWDSIAHSANQAGCDGYISKPFSAKDVIAKVREHLMSRAA